MKSKLKVGILLLLVVLFIAPIPSSASLKKIKVNDTITVTNEDGTQTKTDVYSFTEPYDNTAVNEEGMVKIGEGYTSNGIHYEAFKPANE